MPYKWTCPECGKTLYKRSEHQTSLEWKTEIDEHRKECWSNYP